MLPLIKPDEAREAGYQRPPCFFKHRFSLASGQAFGLLGAAHLVAGARVQDVEAADVWMVSTGVLRKAAAAPP